MSYCLFDYDAATKSTKIIAWHKLDLLQAPHDSQPPPPPPPSPQSNHRNCCVAACKLKNKKVPYTKNGQWWCLAHALNHETCLVCDDESWRNEKELRRKKKDELVCILSNLRRQMMAKKKEDDFLQHDTKKENKMTKEECIQLIESQFTWFETAIPKKKTKPPTLLSRKTDFISLGRNMMTHFDTIPHLADLNHVLIENQIASLSSKMKTVQGMVMQYFLMRLQSPARTVNIEFVSPINKLKRLNRQQPRPELELELLEEEEDEVVEKEPTPKSRYRENKKNAVEFCMEVVNQHRQGTTTTTTTTTVPPIMTITLSPQAESIFSSMVGAQKKSKMDDYADCFLQGYWYISEKLDRKEKM